MLASTLFLAGTLAGCVDDLNVESVVDSSIYEVAEDEYAMGVTISLSQLSGASTRGQIGGPLGNLAGGDGQGLKDIEEYVNTENLYILFFNLDGTYLFQIDKPVAVPIGQSALGNDNQWFIRIPVKQINPNLIKYIEENPFKIAVLANWTFDSDLNLGGDLSGWDEFRFNEPVDADGNLVYDGYGKLVGDNISLLTHAQRDMVYESSTLKHGYDHLVHRTSTGPHMGPYTEWVGNYHKSIDEADTHIRTYFDVKNNKYQNPDGFFYDENGIPTALDHFNTKYNNIWQVWNFGGKDTSNFNFTMLNSEIESDWLDLNQTAKDTFVESMLSQGNLGGQSVMKWQLKNYADLDIYNFGMSAGIRPNFREQPSDFNGMVISWPNISYNDNAEGNPLNLTGTASGPGLGGETWFPSIPSTSPTYIHFKAHADGYVRVNYKARGGAKLYAHVGLNNTPQNNASNYKKANQSNRYLVNEDGYLVNIDEKGNPTSDNKQIADVPFDAKDVYLYMVVDPNYKDENPDYDTTEPGEDGGVPPTTITSGPSVEVYGVEYMESRHLYDVDRRAVLPSKDYPIPMYGVQDFDPIGEYWEPGLLFNLSQYNNAQKEGYNYRNISLLRSLARVEVRLKKSEFPQKPSHVYLRSMNRSARMTPVDIFTPTDIIWNGFNSSSPDDVKRLQNYIDIGNLEEQHIIQTTPGVVQEEKNIIQYGPFYIGNKTAQSGDKLQEYRRTTAWPFGIWERQLGWNWNRENSEVGYFETYKVGDTRAYTGQTVPEYPRILHTRISRSDYSHFAEVDDPEYWHYVLYIPEKNITDADNPGDISDRPKIIHVEIRFNSGPEDKFGTDADEENIVDNFDDKKAYRLYFTQGGRANLGSFEWNGRDSWDDYEYDWNIVKQHWPILRNHVYSFTVNGGLDHSGTVNFQVSAPDIRSTGWMFY